MTAHLIAHFTTIQGFFTWLSWHWPAAPKGCQWEYGWLQGGKGGWRVFCRG